MSYVLSKCQKLEADREQDPDPAIQGRKADVQESEMVLLETEEMSSGRGSDLTMPKPSLS